MKPKFLACFLMLLVLASNAQAQAQEGTEPLAYAGSDTVLVIDVSGSMSEDGKLAGAQTASRNVVDIIQTENRVRETESNRVGLVSFSNSGTPLAALTTNAELVRSQISQLSPDRKTNIAGGMREAIDMLDASASSAKPIIILLSDGKPTLGLNAGLTIFGPSEQELRDEILELAREAEAKNYCIYTIGFGSALELDEQLLRSIADTSGCGAYFNTQDLSQLADIYVELRHSSTGEIILQKRGEVSQGEEIDLGSRTVPEGASSLLYTINWPGSWIDARLIDPQGIRVDENYPNAVIDTQSSVTTVVVDNPKTGEWNFGLVGEDIPQGRTRYNAVASIRNFFEVAPPKRTPLYTTLMLGGLVVFGGVMFQRTRGGTGWVMEVREDHHSPYTLPIRRGGIKVGRGSDCQVRLSDPLVSRYHCRIVPTKNTQKLNLYDQHSRSGTKRNGKRVERATLRDHDRIEVGTTILRVFKEAKR